MTTRSEMERRQKLLEELDEAAYDCAGCLAAVVDTGRIKNEIALRAVRRFRAAMAEYDAINAIDKALGVPQ